MKDETIRKILHHADEHITEQISEAYPMSSEEEKERIYRRIQENLLTDEKPAVSEDYQVSQIKSTGWMHYVSMAAAFVLMMAGTAGAVIFIRNAGENAKPSMTDAGSGTDVPLQKTIITGETQITETEPEELTKELLYSRSARTVKYLHQLSGHIEVWSCNIDMTTVGDVMLDFDTSEFYGTVFDFETNTGEVQDSGTYYTDEGQSVSFTEQVHDESSKRCDIGYGCATDRNSFNSDPTGLHMLAECFCPFEMTAGYLADLDSWEISDTELYQGRECAVLEGKTGKYGSRWDITHWKIIMDIQTGVWLFYEGYADDETVNGFLHTEDIEFDNPEMQVPVITDEEIDQKIAEGYQISEMSAQQREIRKNWQTVTEPEMTEIEIYEIPDTMPEPFASDVDEETLYDFYYPCERRFNTIWPELAALVAEDWGEQEVNYEEITSLTDYLNMYSFIQDFDIPADDVRNAMQDYITAWDAEKSFREDELSAILSGNQSAMLNYFGNLSALRNGDKIYTPAWLYAHSIEDYLAEGITPEMIRENMRYYFYFDFTDEAKTAFLNKLNYFANMD